MNPQLSGPQLVPTAPDDAVLEQAAPAQAAGAPAIRPQMAGPQRGERLRVPDDHETSRPEGALNGGLPLPPDSMLLFHHLGRVYRRLYAAAQPEIESRMHLQPKEVLTLSAIAQGETSPSAIALNVGVPAPTASRLLERLSTAGLVQRELDRDDLRRFRMSLTPRGREVLSEARTLASRILDTRLQAAQAQTVRDAIAALARLEQEAF